MSFRSWIGEWLLDMRESFLGPVLINVVAFRALFLCLGGVVYSGGTRAMLEYFHAIGFPCPQLENPLMYYLCLSTVDRRSRDRFLESSQQIEALVDRFARELPLPESPMNPLGSGKVPLAYGKPGELKVWGVLYL